MPSPSLADLLIREDKEAIYALALAVAQSVGVDTTTWQAGDPTRSLFHIESETLSALEEVVVGYISSGFLDYATGAWLIIKAAQDFNVTVPEASFATCTVRLTNGGGGLYDIDPNDLSFKCSLTGKTYHNTSGGTLASGPGTTLDLTVVADEAGSESSAGTGDIDEMVTTLLGVTCSNTTAAVGVDTQSEAVTKKVCKAKLDHLSPARGSYVYVAMTPALTGTPVVTDARAYPDPTTGTVTVYVRGASGAIGSGDLDLVEAAIVAYATPLCITPVVLSVSNVTVNVTYELWIYKSSNKTTAEIGTAIEGALANMLAGRPIGGDIVPPATTGALYQSMIESTIRGVFPQAFRVSLTTPASDTALTNGQVPVLGTVSATIHLVDDPL